MTKPRDPAVLAAVDKINRRPLPFLRLNYAVELDSWGGRVVELDDFKMRDGDTFADVMERLKHTRWAPDQILELAEGLGE